MVRGAVALAHANIAASTGRDRPGPGARTVRSEPHTPRSQVWFAWHDGTPADVIDGIIADLVALKDKVPGVLDATGGANFTARSRGFSHAICMTFANADGARAASLAAVGCA